MQSQWNISGWEQGPDWFVSEVELRDSLGNTLALKEMRSGGSANWRACDVHISNYSTDMASPLLKRIYMDKNIATPSSPITITAEFEDDLSGMENTVVQMNFAQGTNTSAWFMSLSYAGRNGTAYVYKGTIAPGQYQAGGSFTAHHLYFTDKSQHSSTLYDMRSGISPQYDLSPLDFSVQGTTPDTTPPQPLSIAVSSKAVQAGQPVIFTLTAKDDIAGIVDSDFLQNMVIQSAAGRRQQIHLYVTAREGLSATLTKRYNTGVYDPADSWRVESISLLDKAKRLGATGTIDTTPANFAVQNAGLVDTTAPQVISIMRNKAQLSPGETIVFTVQGQDEGAGVGDADVILKEPGTSRTVRVNAGISAVNGAVSTLVAQYKVPLGETPGFWTVSQVGVRDKTGRFNYVNAPNALLDGSGFTVMSSNSADITTPQIKAFYLNKSNFVSGEELVLDIVTDEEILLSNLSASVSMKGNYKTLGNPSFIGNTPEGWRYQLRGVVWAATQSADQTACAGILSGVNLRDAAGNETYYYNNKTSQTQGMALDMSSVDFALQPAPLSDTAPPVMVSLTADKTTIAYGQTVRYTLTLRDEVSGVDSARLILYNTFKSSRNLPAERVERTGNTSVYTFIYTEENLLTDILWFVGSVSFGDNNRNGITFFDPRHPNVGGNPLRDFSACDVRVYGAPDKAPPVIHGVMDRLVTKGTHPNLLEGITAVDSKDGNVPVTMAPAVNTDMMGTTRVAYQAKDAAGNVATVYADITVADVAYSADAKSQGTLFYYRGTDGRLVGWTTDTLLSKIVDRYYVDPLSGRIVASMFEINDPKIKGSAGAAGRWFVPLQGTPYYLYGDGSFASGWVRPGVPKKQMSGITELPAFAAAYAAASTTQTAALVPDTVFALTAASEPAESTPQPTALQQELADNSWLQINTPKYLQQ